MGRLDDKVAVVTGGTTGIGAAIVERFVAEGASVGFCARSGDVGAAYAASLGGTAMFEACDVTDRDETGAFVDAVADRFGGIDIVIANAGGGGGGQWPGEAADDWQSVVDLNLNGTMFTCQAAWPHLVGRGGGSIVSVSSLSAVMGVDADALTQMGGFQPSASYQASKAGVEGLTVHLAGRGAEHGIRVNALRPGRILTEKYVEMFGSAEAALFWSHYEKVQMLKRHGHVDDVACAALFLASDEASFITAQIIAVDGGAISKV